MSLRDQDNPVVVIWKQKGEVEWKSWIKYDKVVTDEDSGHISCDLASTWMKSQDNEYLDLTEAQRLKERGTQPIQELRQQVVIEKDQDTELSWSGQV